MGARDIWPFASVDIGGYDKRSLPIGANTSRNTADTSWREGEVLAIDESAGDVNVCADGAQDPSTNADLLVLALARSEGEIVKVAGLAGATTDADGRLTHCLGFGRGQFVTRNVFNNSDTNIGPAGSGAMTGVLIGVTCDLWRDNTNPGTVSGDVNGDFGIDINGDYFTITRILDSLGRDTSVSGGTPDLVVFERLNA